MPGKTIVLIHGRDFKPARANLRRLWLEALRFGVQRDHPEALTKFDKAKIEFVYYGNISNKFLEVAKHEKWYDDTASRQVTLDDLKKYKRNEFTKDRYDALPGKSSVGEALADTLGGVLAFLRLSNPIIEAVAPDMREYWNEDSDFGSALRATMIKPLQRAMRRNDSICVIGHSLGTLISYDTFWKFAHTAEYRDGYCDKKIDVWITLGSPLADETVKQHLRGNEADGPRRYPNNVNRWINVAAEDDYVSHDQRVADDYSDMLDYGLVSEIRDERVYNLSLRDGESNPHHEGGYLIHPTVGDAIVKWLNG